MLNYDTLIEVKTGKMVGRFPLHEYLSLCASIYDKEAGASTIRLLDDLALKGYSASSDGVIKVIAQLSPMYRVEPSKEPRNIELGTVHVRPYPVRDDSFSENRWLYFNIIEGERPIFASGYIGDTNAIDFKSRLTVHNTGVVKNAHVDFSDRIDTTAKYCSSYKTEVSAHDFVTMVNPPIKLLPHFQVASVTEYSPASHKFMPPVFFVVDKSLERVQEQEQVKKNHDLTR